MRHRLQRGGPGLWLSACGRLSVRRLGNGAWAVGSLGGADRVGGFTARVRQGLVSQRFGSLRDAAQSMEVALEMTSEQIEPVGVEWRRHPEGGWSTTHRVDGRMDTPFAVQSADGVLLEIRIVPTGNLWQVTAYPAALPDLPPEADLLGSYRYFLGKTRSLRAAQRLVGQELALPWPELH